MDSRIILPRTQGADQMRRMHAENKLQRDIRVKHCFYQSEKGSTAQIVHLDLTGPLPTTKEGYKYILGIADNCSVFVMVIAIKGKMHKEVMEAFANNWMYRVGAPEFLVSDNEFISQAVQWMCQAFNIKHIPTPTYNPRSNTQIERQFQTIKQLLRAVTRGMKQEKWNQWLRVIMLGINANINHTTGLTPFYLIF